MRAFNQGAFFRVTVSGHEVRRFRDRWLCSTLPDRGVSFTFDARNGNLVDMFPYDMDGDDVAALADDARAYGATRLQLTI